MSRTLVIAIAALSFNLNRLVKQAINTYGPEVTQVGTSVSSVVLLPLSGKGRIGGLFVGNPSGYNTPSAITVDGEENPDAAWYYPDPKPAAENIRDHVAFWRGVEVSK